jgi:hypothetical protein
LNDFCSLENRAAEYWAWGVNNMMKAMKRATMKIKNAVFVLAAMVLSFATGNAKADLVAGWDFQTTANGGTAVVAAPNTPNLYVANFGTATMYLNGQEGSSNWVASATTAVNELNAFTGTAINAGPGFSTTTTTPAALALLNSTANGKSAVFKFSMGGFKDLVVSYATQRSGTGFTSQTWAFSTDATNWTETQVVTGIPAGFAAQTLNTITGLDGAATAYLRLTVAGASSAAGNNRLDNIQFNATAVPEPTSMMLLGCAAVGGWGVRRLRRR